METFADKVINFNRQLDFSDNLPEYIRIMNPFKENEEILQVSSLFYRKYYSDNETRKLILGINPGRHGAGITGIPFTDTKRLAESCNIKIESFSSHEPSSVYVYEMIKRFGGTDKFYGKYFISALCPLGFLVRNSKGNWINCNYYDYEELFNAVQPFIIENLKVQVDFGIDTSVCYVLGKKNARFVNLINQKENLFGSVIVLDHPRFIQQYKSKQKEKYISDYLSALSKD
jgi:hypothetical protein